MEPVTLVTAALSIVGPYLVKSGEGFAEKVGGDTWSWLKSKLSDSEVAEVLNTNTDDKLEVLKKSLEKNILDSEIFKSELEDKVQIAAKMVNNQAIKNTGPIKKQINIQQNSGDIKM